MPFDALLLAVGPVATGRKAVGKSRDGDLLPQALLFGGHRLPGAAALKPVADAARGRLA